MTREEAYDEKIAPLMSQIIRICQEHSIPLIANFGLEGEGEDVDLCCATCLLADELNPPDQFIQAWEIMMHKCSHGMIITTRHTDEDDDSIINASVIFD